MQWTHCLFLKASIMSDFRHNKDGKRVLIPVPINTRVYVHVGMKVGIIVRHDETINFFLNSAQLTS